MPYTTETAPKGYTGPVRLTAEQRADCQKSVDRFTASLIAAARDDSDPEYRDNARLLLDSRSISWRLSDAWGRA